MFTGQSRSVLRKLFVAVSDRPPLRRSIFNPSDRGYCFKIIRESTSGMAELDRLLHKPLLGEEYLNGKHPGLLGHSCRRSRNYRAITKPEVGVHPTNMETVLTSSNRFALKESISQAVPVVMQAVTSTIEQRSALPSQQFESALRCFAAWMPSIPARYLIRISFNTTCRTPDP